MRFKSTLTTSADPDSAAEALCAGVDGFEPDLAVLFATHHYDPGFEKMLVGIYGGVNARNLIGCAAAGIVGPSTEVEGQPAAVLWVAEMPGVAVLPFLLDHGDLQGLDTAAALRDRVGVIDQGQPNFVILPDPFSISADGLLDRMDDAFPGSRIVGGLASGAEAAGQTRLFLNEQVLRQGTVGVSLSGAVSITTVVSQGCRPVGETYIVTGCRDNLITELSGRPAFHVLKEVFAGAPTAERALMQSGLHLGHVVVEGLESYAPGDFLVRNVLGVVGDQAIAVGAHLRRGQTIQFHVRDAKTADEDMRLMLRSRVIDEELSPAGALLFTCNGRGAHLFGKPGHDIDVVNELVSGCEVAGFFAAGEIGPVGDATFVHGFTSSLALFTPREQ